MNKNIPAASSKYLNEYIHFTFVYLPLITSSLRYKMGANDIDYNVLIEGERAVIY